MNHEILIRLSSDGFSFIYSVLRGAELIEAATVSSSDPLSTEYPVDEYYGGSEVMD